MSYNKPLSLSLQKEIEKSNLSLDSEINRAFKTLKIGSLLNRSNIMKQKGYATTTLLYLLLLLPFIMKRLTFLWMDNILNAKKDAYYRFLNNEHFNWRAFIYRLAMKIITLCDDVPLKDKTLILDDTISKKTDKNMELVSYHFDHTTHRGTLGYQCVQLGYHNGKQFFPIDVVFHTSKKRPNTIIKSMDKRSSGWKRRKEAFQKKTTVAIDMIKRAYTCGIDASFVLFDSWYAHDTIIYDCLKSGYGVICRLKLNEVRYYYDGSYYTIKQLWQHVAKKKTRNICGFPYRGICIKVTLPKSKEVSLLFVSDGKKKVEKVTAKV